MSQHWDLLKTLQDTLLLYAVKLVLDDGVNDSTRNMEKSVPY
jgi:hypothetical protein